MKRDQSSPGKDEPWIMRYLRATEAEREKLLRERAAQRFPMREKKEWFQEDNPGKPFIEYTVLPHEDGRGVLARLLLRISGLESEPFTWEAFWENIDHACRLPSRFTADDPDFNLQDVLDEFGIDANQDAYLSYQFASAEEVIRLKLNELVRFWDEVWYPSDDVLLFGLQNEWVVTCEHSIGVLQMAPL